MQFAWSDIREIVPFSPFVPCVSACELSNAHAYTVFSAIFPFAWRNVTSARPSDSAECKGCRHGKALSASEMRFRVQSSLKLNDNLCRLWIDHWFIALFRPHWEARVLFYFLWIVLLFYFFIINFFFFFFFETKFQWNIWFVSREILEEEREQEVSMMKHEKRKIAATWGLPDEPPPKVIQKSTSHQLIILSGMRFYLQQEEFLQFQNYHLWTKV